MKEIKGTDLKESFEFKEQSGTGRIISSQKSVHGNNTQFMKELIIGDIIVIQHPQTLLKEEKLIILVLSDQSIQIESAFSSDLISFTAFSFKRKIVHTLQAPNLEQEFSQKINRIKEEQEKRAKMQLVMIKGQEDYDKIKNLSKKIQKHKTTIQYRDKKGMWGYQHKEKVFQGQLSNQEQLDIRCKQSRDKFCWT